MKKFLIIVIILSVLFGAVLQGSFLAVLLILTFSFYGLGVLLLAILCGLFFGAIRGHIPDNIGNVIRIFGIMVLGVILALGAGKASHGIQVWRTQAFVAKVVEELDKIKHQTGTYPEELPIQMIGRPKGFLRVGCYSKEGESFVIRYWDPAGMMTGYQYSGDSRSWQQFD